MKYINADPKLMGGHLVIKGTRIPLEVIFHHLSAGYTLKQIHEKWSYVDFKTLKGAVAEAADLLAQTINAQNLPQA